MIKLVSLTAKGFKQLDIDQVNFPSKGTVLIVGRNESGKSTLFEAIYFSLFGEGLVPSRGPKGLPDLLGYKREKGFVSLTFSVGETLLEITRILKRKGVHEHRLKILSPRQETITGARAVNERIERELKLDGDALLNSCFVEQKNLEKLETLKSDERQKTIARLLNIENFKEMEDAFKEEAKRLEEEEKRNKQKLEFASLLAEIPILQEEMERVEHRILLVGMMRQREELCAKIREGNARMASLRADMENLARHLHEIETTEKDLPRKEKRVESLGDLGSILQACTVLIDDIREIDSELSKMTSDVEHARELEKKIEQLKSEMAEARSRSDTKKTEFAEISTIEGFFSQISLLASWEAAKKAEDEVAILDGEEMRAESQRRSREKERDALVLEKKTVEIRKTYSLLGMSILVLFSAFTLVWGIVKSVFLFVSAGAVSLVFAFVLYLRGFAPAAEHLSSLGEELPGVEESLKRLQDEILRIDGKRDLVRTRGRAEAISLFDVEEEMRQKRFPIPASLADCQELRETISGRVVGYDGKEIKEKARKISDEILILDSTIVSRKQTMESLQADVDGKDIPGLVMRRDRAAEEREKGKTRARELLDTAKRKAGEIDIEPDSNTVTAEFSRLAEEVSSDRKQLAKKADVEKERHSKNGELSLLVSAVEQCQKKSDEIEKALQDDEEALGLSLESERELASRRDVLLGTLTYNRNRADEFRSILGVAHVEKEECAKELAETNKKMAVTVMAQKIANRARKQIEANVLPRIEDNMERFIPSLTSDRYKEVFINPADYRIEIMDEVAGERRPKSVFSGGTRDQLSLALRLSFALATLPEERGSSPSFIFLDEPIGAFDEERRNALIELLTIGEISESFDQIFIISHFSELEEVFEYRIKMDGGKVIETNL